MHASWGKYTEQAVLSVCLMYVRAVINSYHRLRRWLQVSHLLSESSYYPVLVYTHMQYENELLQISWNVLTVRDFSIFCLHFLGAQTLFAFREEEMWPIKWKEQSRVNSSQVKHVKPAKGTSFTSSVLWSVLDHVCCDLVRMSYRVNYSPLLRVHAQPSQPCHKVCDVAFGSCMKGQTLPSKSGSAVLCGSDPPDDGVPALKAHSWPDGVEESSGMERLLRKCQIRNQLVRECLAECLGVYVLIVSKCFMHLKWS